MANSQRPDDLVDVTPGGYANIAPVQVSEEPQGNVEVAGARPSDLIGVDPDYVSKQIDPLNSAGSVAAIVAAARPAAEKLFGSDASGRRSLETYLKSQISHKYPGLDLNALEKEIRLVTHPKERVATMHEVQRALNTVEGRTPGINPVDLSAYEKAAKPTTVAGKIAQPIKKVGEFVEQINPFKGQGIGSTIMRTAGRGALGAGTVYQGSQAYNKALEGDYAGSAIDAAGALGSGLMLIPHPIAKGAGAALTGASMLGDYLYDSPKEKELKGMAAGGLAHFAEGGESNTAPFIGYPRASTKPRDPNFVQQSGPFLGALDALLGSKREDVSMFTPEGQSYRDMYDKVEPYGIAANVLPVLGGPMKAVGKAAARELGPKAAGMAEDYLTRIGGIQNIVPPSKRNLSSNMIGSEFDPRFDTRKLEQQKLQTLTPKLERYQQFQPPTMSIVDMEGMPFVTQMADRSNAGHYLQGINDVSFNRDVDMLGGQGYMFNNPGRAWTSTVGPSTQTMKEAKMLKEFTGKDPFLIPWRMAPGGSDFAHMTGETQLAYAQSAMGRTEKKMLNESVKNFIPDWKGIDNPESMIQFKSAPSTVRKGIQNMIDKDFRDKGGLSIGSARLAIAEPSQVNAPWGGMQNIGRIFADKPMVKDTGHWSYPGGGIPGEGVGVLNAADQQRNIFELLPKAVKERGILDPKNPSADDLRALQMKPYTGIVTDKLLKSIGFAEGGEVQHFQVGGLSKLAKMGSGLILPAAENAAKTQVANTIPTYVKAANELARHNVQGNIGDFGAGKGLGAPAMSKVLGRDVQTYEPYPQNWQPNFTNASDIPDSYFGGLTNLNVLNVLPREIRDQAVLDIGRTLDKGGTGIITTRGRDLAKSVKSGIQGPEPYSVITGIDTYQKGFNAQELQDYLKYMLGQGYDINKLNLGPAGALIKKK